MSATDPVQYPTFDIIVTDKETGRESKFDIRSSVVELRFYEDLYSPVTTASVVVMATGNVQIDKNTKTTLIGGLPIVGQEKVEITLNHENFVWPHDQYTLHNLVVNKVTDITTGNNRESFTLQLISRDAFFNNTNRVRETYKNASPSDHIVNIINDKLLNGKLQGGGFDLVTLDYNNITFEATSSGDKTVDYDASVGMINYKGNSRKPFTVIMNLAAKCRDGEGKTAGFVFFGTNDAYKLKSINNLAKQEPKETYNEINAMFSYTDPKGVDLKRKILAKTVIENNNILENLNYGVYASTRFFIDLYEGQLAELDVDFTPENYKDSLSFLGTENLDVGEDLTNFPSRIFVQTTNQGTLDPTDASENFDNQAILSQSVNRYNTLLTQVINIIVPINVELNVGDVIVCNFPEVGKSNNDVKLSGKYLIKELCHYSSASEAYTSMQIVRDTYGS